MYSKKLAVLAAAVLMTVGVRPASASLIYDASIIISGSGFGAIPRTLSMQQHGQDGLESGCVGVDSGSFDIGPDTCISTALVHDSNGVTNVGGDEPPPLVLDGNKYATPSLDDLAITTASQIGLVFNPTDPACGLTDLTDLTLKFYDGTTLRGAIDGQQSFGATDCGNGSSGFVFRVSNDELAYVNGLIATWGTDLIMAVEASATGATGGPDSFFLYNLTAPPPPPSIPEPTSLLLLGTGLFGTATAAARRRKAAKAAK